MGASRKLEHCRLLAQRRLALGFRGGTGQTFAASRESLKACRRLAREDFLIDNKCGHKVFLPGTVYSKVGKECSGMHITGRNARRHYAVDCIRTYSGPEFPVFVKAHYHEITLAGVFDKLPQAWAAAGTATHLGLVGAPERA